MMASAQEARGVYNARRQEIEGLYEREIEDLKAEMRHLVMKRGEELTEAWNTYAEAVNRASR